MKRSRRNIEDRTSWLAYLFWSAVNKIVTAIRFKDIRVFRPENLPRDGRFILVCNHVSRWDGLLIYQMIGSPANFMVSPNELLGLQGRILTSMGSFPADPRFNVIEFAQSMLGKNHGVVVFPEGNIFRDGSTHPFKNGAARIALGCASRGMSVPVVPAAIDYSSESTIAHIALGEPISVESYLAAFSENEPATLRILSDRLHREVCHLRNELDGSADRLALFDTRLRRTWNQLLANSSSRSDRAETLASNCATIPLKAEASTISAAS